MPTRSYRFYDPAHQASFYHTYQTSGQQSWSQSVERQDFEDAQSGKDMMHIVPQSSWVQYDLSQAKPIYPHSTQTSPLTKPINLYVLSGKTWNHWGAATLTLNPGNGRSSWVTLYTHGSNKPAGSFSVFGGMEIIRFNDAVLCTTIQTESASSSTGPRFVSYAFQTETIDHANELRLALATAVRNAATLSSASASERQLVTNFQEVVEQSMERRLSTWIHAVEGQFAAAAAASSCPFENQNSGTIPNIPRMRRRGGIDHGSAYWDLEKSRALNEARTELDSLQLKRLLSGVQLAV